MGAFHDLFGHDRVGILDPAQDRHLEVGEGPQGEGDHGVDPVQVQPAPLSGDQVGVGGVEPAASRDVVGVDGLVELGHNRSGVPHGDHRRAPEAAEAGGADATASGEAGTNCGIRGLTGGG